MAQGSGDVAGALRNDDRAVVGLFRAVEGAMPGCPAEMILKAKDGAEKRFRGALQEITLKGLVFRCAAPHHLPEIWLGDTVTISVGSGMYRLRGRVRPDLGTDIAFDWTFDEDAGLQAHVHPLGHAPVKPKPLTLTEKVPVPPGSATGQRASSQHSPGSATSSPESRSSKVYRWLQSLGYSFLR